MVKIAILCFQQYHKVAIFTMKAATEKKVYLAFFLKILINPKIFSTYSFDTFKTDAFKVDAFKVLVYKIR